MNLNTSWNSSIPDPGNALAGYPLAKSLLQGVALELTIHQASPINKTIFGWAGGFKIRQQLG
jgi:hypothetical protein